MTTNAQAALTNLNNWQGQTGGVYSADMSAAGIINSTISSTSFTDYQERAQETYKQCEAIDRSAVKRCASIDRLKSASKAYKEATKDSICEEAETVKATINRVLNPNIQATTNIYGLEHRPLRSRV